jgi:glycosyltransferase involved in cell wall biosynthesis
VTTSHPMRERRLAERPFLSVCIPQHNRTSFLIEVCRSLDAQIYRAFEVCISDDCSTDGREGELLAFLERSRLAYVYKRQAINLRYDGNLREAMALAAAPWTLLLGNDDLIKEPETLAKLAVVLNGTTAKVAFTNFEDYRTAVVTRRAPSTGIAGSGPLVAAAAFRKFSFVSGVLFDTTAARAESTTVWDGSEMYQMYIGCRLIAAGGSALDIDQVAVRKDLQLPDDAVESYATRGRPTLKGIPRQQIPLGKTARLVIAAVEPYLTQSRAQVVGSILNQYFGFLYPYWLFEYRRVRSWRFAAGVARGLRPGRSLEGTRLSFFEHLYADLLFVLATAGGLLLPIRMAQRLHGPATRLARHVGDVGVAPSRT